MRVGVRRRNGGCLRLEQARQFRRLQALGEAPGRVDGLAKLLVEVDLGRFLELLTDFVELGFPDHLLDAAVKLTRQCPRLPDPVAGNTQCFRQILWPDHDERNDPDQHQLRHAEVKQHRRRAPRRPGKTKAAFASGAMMSDATHMGNLDRRASLGRNDLAHTSLAASGKAIAARSSRPVARSSSSPGRSFTLSRPKWTRNSRVVTHRSGRPGPVRRPFGRTQPTSISASIVPLAATTPRICSISARVTGWW